MEVRVLGAVEVRITDGAVHLARRQQRLILGILAIEANRVVTRDRLSDLIWGSQPPRLARAVLQSRVSELRATLARHLHADHGRGVLTQGGGYVLDIKPELVDVHRFRTLLTEAQSAASPEEARRLLRSALGLWRGQVLSGWLPAEAHATLCGGIEADRLTAAEDLFEIELQLGNHHATANEITSMATAHPTHERLVAQAMTALHRTGRTAEALLAFDRCRRWLADELGVDPGIELRDLYLALLRGERLPVHDSADGVSAKQLIAPRLDTVAGAPEEFLVDIPRTLPGDISDFTGRAAEIAKICDLLTRERDQAPVVAIDGQAGIGKTVLSIHIAHLTRDSFPDGQLFADLRGLAVGEPAAPFDVLGRFLRALGVGGQTLPTTLDERVDLYRGLVADRRILVVLDNAATADQILPLLPAGTGCATLVNSRIRLGHAVGAEAISLGLLDIPESTELLARIAGSRRVESEADAVVDLTNLCGNLPLAIRIAGAKLATKPHWSIRKLTDRLDDERQRLDRLTYGHLDVRSSIGMSYTGLTAEAQQLLRRLGDIDMPVVNVWSAAALLDTAVAEAEEILEQLYDARLVDVAGEDPTGHARYRLHDLVKLLASEHAASDEPAGEREACRMHTAGAWLSMTELVHRGAFGGDYMTIDNPAPRRAIETHLAEGVAADPLHWFDHERHAILAMVRQSARDGNTSHSWGIAEITSPLFQMRYYYDEWTAVLDSALSATQQARDDVGRAAMMYRMGAIHADRRDYIKAVECLHSAAALFETSGHEYGRAIVTAHAAQANRLRGNLEAALRGYKQALPTLVGDYGGEAYTLRGIGQVHMTLGDYSSADSFLAQALRVARLRGSRRSEAQALFWQGMLHLRQEEYELARPLFTEALVLTQVLGDRPGEAQALRGLGLCHKGKGETEAAANALSAALRLVRQPRATSIETSIRRELAEVNGV